MKKPIHIYLLTALLLTATLPVVAQQKARVSVKSIDVDTLVFVDDGAAKKWVIKTRKSSDDSTEVEKVLTSELLDSMQELDEVFVIYDEDEDVTWVTQGGDEKRVLIRTVHGDDEDIHLSVDHLGIRGSARALPSVLQEEMDVLRGMTAMNTSTEIRKHEAEARKLGAEARMAEGDEQEALISELDEKLAMIFELKQQARLDRIDLLRERLAALEDEHGERQDLAEEIIRKRLDELMGRSSKFDW